jgi:hypothetical protein
MDTDDDPKLRTLQRQGLALLIVAATLFAAADYCFDQQWLGAGLLIGICASSSMAFGGAQLLLRAFMLSEPKAPKKRKRQ